MLRSWWRLPASLLLCAGVARADGSLRCGSRLVSVGDARIDLLGRCGEPALRERRVDEAWTGVTDGKLTQGTRITAVIEEWTYDFGPHAFVHVVTLVNGRITAIERRSYGYSSDGPRPFRIPRSRCDPATIPVGDAKLDVLARCGEPAMVDAWDDTRGVSEVTDPALAAASGTGVRVEVWTYDLGPTQFVRFVRLENGRVASVTTGTYGYAD